MKISGVCFPDEEKKSQNHPDASGPGELADATGTSYQVGDGARLAIWKKTNQNTGKPFLSWSLELDDKTIEYARNRAQQQGGNRGSYQGHQGGTQGGGQGGNYRSNPSGNQGGGNQDAASFF